MSGERPDLDFAFAQALAPLLGEDLEQPLSGVLENSRVYLPAGGAFLFSWPDRARGIMSLAEVHGEGPPDFIGAWPFAGTLTDKEATVWAVHRYAPRPELAIIECEWEGNPFWLFDTYCLADKAPAIGRPAKLALHGWATKLAPARLDPIVRPAAALSKTGRELYPDRLEADGSLPFDTSELVYLNAARDIPCPLHGVRGIVTGVGPEYEVGDTVLRRLSVTAARSSGDPERVLSLDLTLTRRVWEGDWPQAGQPVEGMAWLQGSIHP